MVISVAGTITENIFRRCSMISVGIDISKGTSTVCLPKPYGEIVSSPFEVRHVESELKELTQMILRMDDEIRVVMEATGIYHLPVLTYLQSNGIFVAVINPFEMKEYASRGLRRVKTDKHDAVTISNYGIVNWFHLKNHEGSDEIYSELKLLGRQYCHYMEMHVKSLLELTHMPDYTMPGIKEKFKSWNEANGKDKPGDFVERYWHYGNITAMSEEEFSRDYCEWAKSSGAAHLLSGFSGWENSVHKGDGKDVGWLLFPNPCCDQVLFAVAVPDVTSTPRFFISSMGQP